MIPNHRDIEYLFEIASLRNQARGWTQQTGMKCASVLEHTVRVMLLALLLARKEGVKNEEKIMKMVLVHDLAEARVSDLGYIQKVYVKADEKKAAQDMYAGTNFKDLEDILEEYEKRDCPEAKIVKDADNLDVDFEMKELEEMGSQLPRKWQKFRKIIREKKFYTAAAKELWDFLQDKDPADWHTSANKWLKIENAGL